MQLRHVETFLAILDAGTLTAAAARLHKTQAAVAGERASPAAESIIAVATDPPLVRQLSLAHPAKRTLPPVVRDFADHVVRYWPAV